jgi:hypothetical protein
MIARVTGVVAAAVVHDFARGRRRVCFGSDAVGLEVSVAVAEGAGADMDVNALEKRKTFN